jgi:hypothetical protein
MLRTPASGGRITSRVDADALGFISIPLWKPESNSVFECKRMEHILQSRYQHLEFGHRRLWHVAGAGSEYLDEYGTVDQPAMVYLTIILDVQPQIANGTLIAGNPVLTKAFDMADGTQPYTYGI